MGVVVSNFHLAKITAEEKVKLTSGKDFWTSEHLADKGIPSFRMSDGPHGLRIISESMIVFLVPVFQQLVLAQLRGILISFKQWVRRLD